MAWSDAARAAALEARRMHARAKVNWSNDSWHSRPSGNVTGKAYRKSIADRLRTVRSGGKLAAIGGHVMSTRGLTEVAAISTFMRNYNKAYDRRYAKKK